MESADGFYRDTPRRSYGFGDQEQASRGRRPGQTAPRAAGSDPGGRPSNDGGTPATAPTSVSQPAPVPDGPMAIQPPANDLAMLLHKYGKRPSMKRPNGPIPQLVAGQIEFNPFENRWVE